MKTHFQKTLIALLLLLFPAFQFAQTVTLGSAASFVLFTSNGAITNVGPSQITGDVGSNSGAGTGFGNVNGNMQSSNGITGLASIDLGIAYAQLNLAIPGFFPASPLGNGSTLTAGVYSLSGNTVLSNTLTLNAQGTSTAVFIFQISGTFSSNTLSKIILINGAKACNVYFKVEGAVSLASGSELKGTIIANNAAIDMAAGVILEGRAMSTAGAVSINSVTAFTPIGCGSPFLTGPASPTLASTACYALFSSDGAVSNSGVTTVTGDIGTNNGLTTGYNALLVTGVIHPIPDLSTAACALDLGNIYTYLNGLTADINLLYPAQFGNNLVLTPHVYLMNGGVTLTDSLYLNAEGNPNAVFVIQINGAISTSGAAKVILMNGAQSKNVFWKVDGAVGLNTNAIMRGTIICNNAAISLATGVFLDGRALTTTGALTTVASTIIIPSSIEIIVPPTSQTVCAGAAVIFSVSATGPGLTYQWRKGLINLVNAGNISGVTTATLSINPVLITDAANDYNVVVNGSCSPSLTTANATLVVNTTPSITAVIPSQTVCAGTSVIFTVNPTGTGFTYQWRNGAVNLVNAGNISGVTTATLSIATTSVANASNNYNLIISGVCAPNFTSANFALVVNSSPSITAAVPSQTVCAGASVSFSVNPTGSGLTYQWRNGIVNLSNAGSVSGATSPTLTINPVISADASANYNLIISGVCAPNFTSSNISLVVNTSPTITAVIPSQTVCAGTSVIFTVNPTGTGLTYQWRNGAVNLINAGNISGVTTATLSIATTSVLNASNNYNLIISGVCAPNFTSANFALVVNSSPSITTVIASQTVCAGSSVSFSVNPTGSGLTYQWRNGSVNLSNAGNISGATSPTLTINPVNSGDASLNYNLIISGVCAPNFTSSNITLVVNSSPSITAVVPSQTVCAGSAVIFSFSPTGTGLTYQWRNGLVNLNNAGSVSGVTTPTLSINPVNLTDASANYNVIITGVCAPNYTSATISLVVNTSPSLSVVIPSQTICAGGPVIFASNPTGSGLTYQWRNGTVNLTNTGNITGATSPTLSINPTSVTDASNFYNLVISGVCAPNFTSTNIALVITTSANISASVPSQTVCAGSSVVFSVNATGSGLTYQWRNGAINLTNGGNVFGATTQTLTLNPVVAANTSTNYNLVISGVCGANYTTANISLLVNTSPTLAAAIPSQTICEGATVNFSVNASGSGLTYQWRKGTTNLINAGNVSGVTSPTLVINSATFADASNFYNLIINGSCAPGFTSSNVSLVVNTSPSISAQASSQTVCAGTSVTFSAITSGTGLTYQWRNGSTNLSNNATTSGVNSATLNINPVSSGDGSNLYNLVITGICGSSFTSTNMSLLVNSSASLSSAINSQTVCAGGLAKFIASSTGAGLTYQWRKGSVNLTNGGSISGVTSATLTINPVTSPDAANDYNLLISGSCGATFTSTNVSLVVNPFVIAQASAASTVCIGDAINLSAQTVSGANYNWKGPNAFTSTNQNPVILNASNSEAGNYSLTVTSAGCVSGSSTISVLVLTCVNNDFHIPEGFSPNGDGINDFFVIRGLDNFPNNNFVVFNRWGSKVFEASPYQNNWDGKATMGIRVGGDELPLGTYFYVLDLGDGSHIYKGTIYLNR